jgi:hypothetical protein
VGKKSFNKLRRVENKRVEREKKKRGKKNAIKYVWIANK